jgi:hypothetical protein
MPGQVDLLLQNQFNKKNAFLICKLLKINVYLVH